MISNGNSEVTPLLPPSHTIIVPPQPPVLSQSQLAVASTSSSLNRTRRISWENYLVAVEKYPIRTKCITAWIIFIAADTFAQVIEYLLYKNHLPLVTTPIRNMDIDWIRSMRFGALGLFGAPWSHYYFQWLDHYLPPSEEPFTKRTAIKVGIDQLLQAPILLAVMIFSLSLMKGQGVTGAKQDLSNTFMESLIANCTIRNVAIFLSFSDMHHISTTFAILFTLASYDQRETVDTSFYH